MGRVPATDPTYWNYQAKESPAVSDPHLLDGIETYTTVEPESKRRIVRVVSRLKEPEPRSLQFQGSNKVTEQTGPTRDFWTQKHHHIRIPDLHQALFLNSVRGLFHLEYSELHTANTRIFLVAKLSRSDCQRLDKSGFRAVCCLLCGPDSANDAVYDWYLTRQDGLGYNAGKQEYRE